jgi:hypothetical protein
MRSSDKPHLQLRIFSPWLIYYYLSAKILIQLVCQNTIKGSSPKPLGHDSLPRNSQDYLSSAISCQGLFRKGLQLRFNFLIILKGFTMRIIP